MKNNIRVMAESALMTGKGQVVVKDKTFAKGLVSTIDVDTQGMGDLLRAQNVNKVIKIHSAIDLLTGEQIYPVKKIETEKSKARTNQAPEVETINEKVVEEIITEKAEEIAAEEKSVETELFYCPVEGCDRNTEGYSREQDLKKHMINKHGK